MWTGVAYSLPTPTSIPSISYRRSKYIFEGNLDATKYTKQQWTDRKNANIKSGSVTKGKSLNKVKSIGPSSRKSNNKSQGLNTY